MFARTITPNEKEDAATSWKHLGLTAIFVAATAFGVVCGQSGGGTSSPPLRPADIGATIVAQGMMGIEPTELPTTSAVDVRFVIDFPTTEREIGWRLLRQSNPRFHFETPDATIQTFAELSIPRVRVLYHQDDPPEGIILVQEPQRYRHDLTSAKATELVNGFKVAFASPDGANRAIFETGETVNGETIFAEVSGSGYTKQNLRSFIETLTFEP